MIRIRGNDILAEARQYARLLLTRYYTNECIEADIIAPLIMVAGELFGDDGIPPDVVEECEGVHICYRCWDTPWLAGQTALNGDLRKWPMRACHAVCVYNGNYCAVWSLTDDNGNYNPWDPSYFTWVNLNSYAPSVLFAALKFLKNNHRVYLNFNRS